MVTSSLPPLGAGAGSGSGAGAGVSAGVGPVGDGSILSQAAPMNAARQRKAIEHVRRGSMLGLPLVVLTLSG